MFDLRLRVTLMMMMIYGLLGTKKGSCRPLRSSGNIKGYLFLGNISIIFGININIFDEG